MVAHAECADCLRHGPEVLSVALEAAAVPGGSVEAVTGPLTQHQVEGVVGGGVLAEGGQVLLGCLVSLQPVNNKEAPAPGLLVQHAPREDVGEDADPPSGVHGQPGAALPAWLEVPAGQQS